MSYLWSNASVLLAIIAFFSTGMEVSQAYWKDFELGALQDMNGTGSVIEFNVKTKRVNRTMYGITGTITLNDDFSKYEVCVGSDFKIMAADAKLYVSTQGNDQYVLSPIKVPRGPLCTKVNDDYRKYLMKDLSISSDLPNSDDVDICPLFVKKTYHVKDYLFAAKTFPSFLQSGWYKLQILIYDKDGAVVSGCDVYSHLY